jgi:hypothetical protein
VVLPQPAFAVIQSKSALLFSSQEIYFRFSKIHPPAFLERFKICDKNKVWSIAPRLDKQTSVFSDTDATLIGGSGC